jgi:sRNA-binding protein
MRKGFFSARQNAKKGSPLKLKDQMHNRPYLQRRFPECDSLYLSLDAKPLKVKVFIKFNEKEENVEIIPLH